MSRVINRPEPCSVDGCSEPGWSRELCNKHYLRVWRFGSTELPKRMRARAQKTCQICGNSYSVEPRKAESSKFCSRKCLGRANGNRQRVVTEVNFFEWAGQKEGCWEWPFSRDKDGYGKYRLDGETRAHRVAYILSLGPIPPGKFVCHNCDNPPCIRPDHLFLGNPQINAADMAIKGRAIRGESTIHPS